MKTEDYEYYLVFVGYDFCPSGYVICQYIGEVLIEQSSDEIVEGKIIKHLTD